MITMVSFLTLSLSSLLALFILYCTVRVARAPQPDAGFSSGKQPSVSICIPFRNEAHNLPCLLASLGRQSCEAPFEIILINDGSTDEFDPAVREFANTYPAISCLVIDSHYDPTLQLTSKQQALDTGVARASGEWVVFTDADMRFDKAWLQSLLQCAGNDKSFIYGHTSLISERPSLFAALQAFQLEFLFAAAYTFHHAGVPGSCMGNNIAVARNAYLRVGGQKGIGYSIVEDRDLFRAFIRSGMRPAPAEPFLPYAFSFPAATPAQFFHQSLRWAKGGMQGSWILQAVMLLLGLQNIAFPFALAGLLPDITNCVVIVNAALLMAFTAMAFHAIGSRSHALIFALYYPFLILETIVVGIAVALRLPVTWKGRRV
jgi:cellulose synthase/poly-beta-1,6-N-acetylglucosamine synthase-like glycosyltransferase